MISSSWSQNFLALIDKLTATLFGNEVFLAFFAVIVIGYLLSLVRRLF
jgi:hypothetical protein